MNIKRLMALIITAAALLSLTACDKANSSDGSSAASDSVSGASEPDDSAPSGGVSAEDTREESAPDDGTLEESTPDESTPSGEDTREESAPDEGDPAQTAPADPLSLLQSVWNAYPDEERFPAAGGDYSEENMAMDAPGNFGLEDTETLDSMLGFPAGSAVKIDGAASLMHMMNANTFTCGAYHVVNKDDISSLADEIKENVLARQWMCGFPDKLIVMSYDSFIISVFGNAELADGFASHVTEVCPEAAIVYDEPIV